jgi:ATP-dependent Lon protease
MPIQKEQSIKTGGKKYQTRSSGPATKLKKNEETDSSEEDNDSNNDESESEDEDIDMHEYRKMISKIFPSKFMTNKVKSEAKLLKRLEEESEHESDEYEDDDEEDDEVIEKKEAGKHNKRTKKYESSKNKRVIRNVKDKRLKKKTKKEESESEDIEETEDDSDEEEDDSDYEEGEEIELVGRDGKKAFNIIFTIGGKSKNDDESDSEEDSEDDDEDSEDDDDEDSEDESEDDDEESEDKNNKIRSKQNLEETHIKQQETFAEIRKTFECILEKDPANKIAKSGLVDLDSKEKKMNSAYEKRMKSQKGKNVRKFKNLVNKKSLMNDYKYFKDNLSIEEQKKVLYEVEEINKINIVQKPYRLTLLESDIPIHLKSIALNKISSLRNMDPGNGEYYKIKNWVDTFMQIPFNRYRNLPLTIDDGIEQCHEYMAQSKNVLDTAVYGLNDAKLQIMQMIGQWISNPDAIGTAIAIKGPMGTGKTTLVKEGISKILNRDFAFIALGGATDSSFLEGHSYTYEGSTWGKIVDILVKTKSMNPVIYFDELDKISDTPKGDEIAGILTHLTDTTQNSQFHDKYFTEVEFDLSKCLFIFSYNDESKVSPILRDRMYRIQTKGYDNKEKVVIAKKHLLPKIREQVNFTEEDIIIPDETIHYLASSKEHTKGEDGVRNLKRCLEIIYTKLNLFRLIKPDEKIFDNELDIDVTFPFTVTPEIVDKFIKKEEAVSQSVLAMYV